MEGADEITIQGCFQRDGGEKLHPPETVTPLFDAIYNHGNYLKNRKVTMRDKYYNMTKERGPQLATAVCVGGGEGQVALAAGFDPFEIT